ncbi:MAG: dephospho-CoA kinase [Acidobacteria bacterium]|nr:MAG: dephospho-CoA kinase [Acidobacteriota bacterium]
MLNMLKVGLTGGIACGKSYTLKEFQRYGAHTIDADKIVHQLLMPGHAGYKKVVEAFGSQFLNSDSQLDRRRLADLVFSDGEALRKLNEIMHPLVFAEEKRQIEEAELIRRRTPMIVVDAALMVETGSYRNYDVILMVYSRPEVQLMRLILRDHLTEQEASKRIASQMPLLQKLKYADYVIQNSGKLSNTAEQVAHTFKDLVFRYEENDFQGSWKLRWQGEA